jgi:tRNA pseudouridine55 synthase
MEELRPYILLVSKPFGVTSFQFTDRVKKLLKAKKAGHTGTLDPMATGLMVIALNGATRFIPFIDTDTKEYVIQVKFGIETDTDDITGNIIKKGSRMPDLEEIQLVLDSLTGNIKQEPPLFSAKKVKGKRLYKYAREGKEIEVKEVEVSIYKIDILFFNRERIVLRVLCSKGTYMRSFARDLGRKLDTFATLSAIARTKVGKFSLKDSTFISCIEKGDRRGFVPLGEAIDLPELVINNRNKFINGIDIKTKFVKVFDKNGSFIGIGKIVENGIHPERVINEDI